MPDAMKYVVQVQGREEIKELTDIINRQEAAIAKLNQQLKDGTISETQFAAAARPLGENIRVMNEEIARVNATLKPAQEGFAGFSREGRGAIRDIGRVGLALGSLGEGFDRVLTTAPYAASMMGASGPVVAALAAAAIAAKLLYDNLGKVSDFMQSNWSGGTVEQLQAIREAAEEASKAFDKLSKTPSEAQKGAMGAAERAITEGPTGDIYKAVRGLVEADPTLRALARPKPNFGPFSVPGDAAQAGWEAMERRRMQVENDTKTKELIANAGRQDDIGVSARATLARMQKMHPNLFPPNFDPNSFTPEGQKAQVQRRLELEGERNNRKMEADLKEKALDEGLRRELQGERNNSKMMADLKDATNRRSEMLTKEGQRNEELAAEKLKRQRIQILEEDRDRVHDAIKIQRELIEKEKENAPRVYGSLREAMTANQQMVLDAVPQQQLEVQKAMERKLEQINDSIKQARIAPATVAP